MKIKGAVKFFAIALAVVCLFQLSFTFIAGNEEGKADKYAKGNAEKKRRYIDSTGRKTILNIGLKKYNYLDVKERALNLGLDLRGGMHVTLEVAMNELLARISDNNDDQAFKKSLEDARVEARTSQKGYIDLFYEQFQKNAPGRKLYSVFASRENKDKISSASTDEQVLKYLKEEAKSALDRTFNIIRTRIDKFGVTQPNITLDVDGGRITVELPGADDPERVRKYLQGSAKLEFFGTYKLKDIYADITAADKFIYDREQALKINSKDSKADSSNATKNEDSTAANGLKLASASKDSTKKDPKAKKDVQKDFPLIKKMFAGGINQQMMDYSRCGMVLISDTALVNKYLAMPEIKSLMKPNIKFAWSNKAIGEGGQILELVALKTSGNVEDPALLDGSVITDARKDVDPQSNSYQVAMQMNTEGAKSWARITRDNIGRSIAIVLDGAVYSYPNVNNEIPGGRSQITGNFTATEAGDLANILKAGKLPVRLDIIEEAVVGPSLGKEAIQSGLYSLLAGLGAIILFMVVYYNKAGWVANVALLINLFFIIGILTSLNAALTLPGIAGIVLTLATAVDANVLIYERIRDELREGKVMKTAIAEGFQMAMSSILDANMVSLLLGIILMTFGQGPIYGFAVILVIGILTTLFCSILITRLIFDWLLEKDKPINFERKGTGDLLRNINFDFVGKRKIFYIISGVTILIGIISLATKGLNYSVELEGGFSYVVKYDKSVKVDDIKQALTPVLGNSTPEVKTFGNDQTVDIVTKYMTNEGSDANTKVKNIIVNSTKSLGNPTVLSEQRVGATIASDIKNSAWQAVLASLIMIFIYIVVRFKRWQFALGATVALAHDILFVLTFFSLFKDVMPFSLDIDQAIIAALLTIAGYSMNDTVVVFDRIREFLKINNEGNIASTINEAINKTLSRTVVTSFTIFVVVLVLFLFGGQVIKGFAFAMLVGIVIGTYSSIFVATPIVVDFHGADKKLK